MRTARTRATRSSSTAALIGTNQQWRMLWSYNDGYAQFQNVNSGLCLSVDGLSTADYRRYTQNPCYWWAANEQLHPMLP
jgi:hypothetical protein